jgi:hypothetical protein
MRWVDAWNDLNDIVGGHLEVPCQLPDDTVVSVDECLAWLQKSVYDGYAVRVENGCMGHRRGVLALRSIPELK